MSSRSRTFHALALLAWSARGTPRLDTSAARRTAVVLVTCIATTVTGAMADASPQSVGGTAAPAAPLPEGPALVLPHAAFSWRTDGFGQVVGDTIACPPLPGRIKSIVPGAPLPSPLSAKEAGSSLRISATTSRGPARDIAALQWSGPVITWQRMPVSAPAFEGAVRGLAAWMMTNTFTVTLEDGRVLQVGTEPQRLSAELRASDGASATVGIAGVPKGMAVEVPKAAPAPQDGKLAEGPFLIEMARSDARVLVATHPDTLIEIEIVQVPAQVRVRAMTPSGSRVARATEEIAVTDELLKGAPPDQRKILESQRATQQAELDRLRKAAEGERVRPTTDPIVACLIDPASRREYASISIVLKDGTEARDGARGQRQRDRVGSAPATRPGAP